VKTAVLCSRYCTLSMAAFWSEFIGWRTWYSRYSIKMVLEEHQPVVTCSSNLAKWSVNPGISCFALAINIFGESW